MISPKIKDLNKWIAQIDYLSGSVCKLEYLKNVIKGIVIGIAMMVPGVSGGTMAIVLGIYDRLVHSVATIFRDFKNNLLFLVQVGIGGAAGVLIFSRLMEGAMTSYPYIMRYLIMGVIIGGLPLLFKKAAESRSGVRGEKACAREDGYYIKEGKAGRRESKAAVRESTARPQKSRDTVTAGKADVLKNGPTAQRAWSRAADYIFLVLGAAIVLLMSLEPESLIDMATDGSLTSYIFLVISGFIIAVGVVLPGISWSFMLLVLGMYEITLNAINTFNIPFLIPLGIGIALGTFGTAKAIERFLQKYPRKTYMLIIGFVAGSLAEVYPGVPRGWQLPASAAAFIGGFAAIFILGKKGFAE